MQQLQYKQCKITISQKIPPFVVILNFNMSLLYNKFKKKAIATNFDKFAKHFHN